jgi:hypothetical protein
LSRTSNHHQWMCWTWSHTWRASYSCACRMTLNWEFFSHRWINCLPRLFSWDSWRWKPLWALSLLLHFPNNFLTSWSLQVQIWCRSKSRRFFKHLHDQFHNRSKIEALKLNWQPNLQLSIPYHKIQISCDLT